MTRQRQDLSVYQYRGIVSLELLSAPAYRRRLEIPVERLADVIAILLTQLPHVCGLQGYNPMIDPPCPACSTHLSSAEGGSNVR